MPVWNVSPIEDEPSLALCDWRVYEVRGVYGDSLSRHFVGTRVDEHSGRVSSGIRQFDAKLRRGTTNSGRVYELAGRPGWSSDGEYVWDAFCRVNAVRDVRDVTTEVLKELGSEPRDSRRKRS